MKPCLTALAVSVAAALAAACSTTPVPGVCCVGPEDCSRLGLSEDRPCLAGQACVDFHCVAASCSNQGCPAEAPICDLTTDACRGCQLDTECPSGACGDDGACVAEDDVVYLHPDGQDVAPCSRSAPCSGPQFGIRQTNGTRNHVVMAPGLYSAEAQVSTIRIDPQTTLASSVFVHGGGSTLTGWSFEILLDIRLPTAIRDLQIEYGSTAIFTFAETRLERVRIAAADGVQGSSLKARDVSFQTTSTAISVDGTLALDRVTISGGTSGISTGSMTSIQISNLLVYGTSDVALDLRGGAGVVSFATIVDSGINSTSASGISCLSQGPAIRSSIIWTPGAPRPPVTGTCSLASTIAGPTGVVGAMNVDPLFVSPQIRDYHLTPNSPARDMTDSGPMTDLEGDPRPRGLRFDIGADEAP